MKMKQFKRLNKALENAIQAGRVVTELVSDDHEAGDPVASHVLLQMAQALGVMQDIGSFLLCEEVRAWNREHSAE